MDARNERGSQSMTRDEAIAQLNPELIAYLDRPFDDLTALPLPEARTLANAAVRALGGPPQREPEVFSISGVHGEPNLEVRVHTPKDTKIKRAILHVHGGGMVKGSAIAFDGRICELANSLQSIIVSVEYRLAPETPFPGPLRDCVAAWNWLINQAPTWGLTVRDCVLTGDSSGGGLAAATTLFLRDTGGILPARQILVFPMLDYLTGIDDALTDKRLGWTSGNNQFGWRALLGDQPLPLGDKLGHYSPAHALSFRGLPQTWIGVGSIDLFLNENIDFAAALARAGNDVTLCTYKGAPHAFQSIDSALSRRFFRDYFAALLS
jgi:acetyl esterase